MTFYPKILKDNFLIELRSDALLFANWWQETRNRWGHLWPNGWSAPSTSNPRTLNPNLQQMETRRNLWQQTIRPWILFQILSKETHNTLQVSGLRTHHFVQIQFIQTSPDQHFYEKQMPVLNDASRHLMTPSVQRAFHSTIFSTTIIFIEKVFMLMSNPNPRNSNRRPEPKTT